MNILVAAFAYNERPYIPYMVEYYRNQGCDLLILDNYSNDGTYEWLVENHVRTGRVDTNESFHLVKLQQALIKQFDILKPDWIVYTGIDLYYYFPNGIVKEIEKVQHIGATVISVGHLEAHNTGELFKLPFQSNYHCILTTPRKLKMIAQYQKSFRFSGDGIIIPRAIVYESDGFLINYGMCKPKAEREVTFERRKRAWELGNPRGHGTHYQIAKDRDWVWTKPEFIDIRTTDYYKIMQSQDKSCA
jgi:hypothetical protein